MLNMWEKVNSNTFLLEVNIGTTNLKSNLELCSVMGWVVPTPQERYVDVFTPVP